VHDADDRRDGGVEGDQRRGVVEEATAWTATASVGATTAPSASAAARPTAGTRAQSAKPTAARVTTTTPTESTRMLSRRARMSARGVRIAAAKSSGGSSP
jgi:hypothetical protein